jgi:hypothetical protein
VKPEPVRLRDPGSGAPDTVRALLDEGAGELPDAADLARLERRLPIGTPPPVPPAAAPWAIGGPAIGLAIALAAVGGALLHNAATAPATAPPADTAPSAAAAPEAPSVPVAAPSGPASALPRAEPPPPEAPQTRPGPAPSAAGEGAPEIELLDRAHAALAADPARALAIVAEHERRFPRGTLGQEREVIAVGALVALGRVSEARARAARFVELFPRSAYRRRIEALVPGPAKEP